MALTVICHISHVVVLLWHVYAKRSERHLPHSLFSRPSILFNPSLPRFMQRTPSSHTEFGLLYEPASHRDDVRTGKFIGMRSSVAMNQPGRWHIVDHFNSLHKPKNKRDLMSFLRASLCPLLSQSQQNTTKHLEEASLSIQFNSIQEHPICNHNLSSPSSWHLSHSPRPRQLPHQTKSRPANSTGCCYAHCLELHFATPNAS